MRRRELIISCVASAVVPFGGRAQQPSMPFIGMLRTTPYEPFRYLVSAFQEGLGEVGYADGHNVVVEYRWADNDLTRLPSLAADLIAKRPAAMVANGAAVRAIRQLDGTVPVVFVLGDDPVKLGFVERLSRPGGHTTGVTFFGGGSLNVKRLEFLHELASPGRIIAVLVDQDSEGKEELPNVESAARSLGRTIAIVTTTAQGSLETAFDEVAKTQPGALLVSGSPLFTTRRRELVELAARHGLPASYDQRSFVEAGGLMSYGTSFTDAYRQAGVYVGRILGGQKPGDLPVAQPTKFEMAVNLKTAKALDLVIPPSLLARADEVIE